MKLQDKINKMYKTRKKTARKSPWIHQHSVFFKDLDKTNYTIKHKGE